MATVHATALHTPEGRTVLLLGAKGAGKTSTALALTERSWVHAGDDLVVLGENRACARWRSHLITRLASCRFDYLYAPYPETAADLLTKEADTG
jgi:ABC-type branched-subunit amino acid transport system ATPase component